jgi:CYTH domain-containing protein
MLEIEKTYLAKELPFDLTKLKKKEIIDIYIPVEGKEHAPIRIRKNGEKYEITKKSRLNENSGSQLIEETINLTKEEFETLEKQISGKRVRKIRHYYDYEGRTAEIDIFKEKLEGLVIIEFEFENEKDLNEFCMPPFCLADVTEAHFTRGGVLAGKSYAEIENELSKHNYKKII